MKILIRFRHGLGDAVQLTSVIRALKHVRSDWEVDVSALRGKHSAFSGLARRVFVLDEDEPDLSEYTQVLDLDWPEPDRCYENQPSTKAERCLHEIFGVSTAPPSSWDYQIHYSEDAREAAGAYLRDVAGHPDDKGKYPAVVIHYQGNTSAENKDLQPVQAQVLCETVLAAGYVPIILDWDRRSPLIDDERIFCPREDHALWMHRGTGDAERIAALIDQATLFVGIDSGPQKVAASTSTQSIAVWHGHHPLHYCPPTDTVRHIVPTHHGNLLRGAGDDTLRFFEQHYDHVVHENITRGLAEEVGSALGQDAETIHDQLIRILGLRSTAYDRQYYEEHKAAGLDYLGFGEWQLRYGRWLADSLDLRGKAVLDVGCACGSIVLGLGEAGVVVCGCDLSEEMVQLGREKWPGMTNLLKVCDASNLHYWKDDSFDAIHTAQVAEHWKPELVPIILRELRRVTKPGGLLFCSLDTEEMMVRQNREMEHEDPTHYCIRPMAWWHEQLAAAGWSSNERELGYRLHTHPETFLDQYDWDWFLARNTASNNQAPQDPVPQNGSS